VRTYARPTSVPSFGFDMVFPLLLTSLSESGSVDPSPAESEVSSSLLVNLLEPHHVVTHCLFGVPHFRTARPTAPILTEHLPVTYHEVSTF